MQNYQIITQKNTWKAIGVMSGTSVDGLDIVAVKFEYSKQRWHYKIIKAVSISYPQQLRTRLTECIHVSGEELVVLDLELGRLIGQSVSDFLKEEDMQIDLIASHGHTVYHQPEIGITKQIGDGQSILEITGILTINDFRTIDVIKGGQGAPLVPIGDKLLFPEYDICLNIGGFANISYDNQDGIRLAFDTGPANLLLNYLARKMGKLYDMNGETARKGTCIPELINEMNALPYYEMLHPKSLGLEWVEKNIYSKFEIGSYKIEDLMHTCVKHIAYQINRAILRVRENQPNRKNRLNILITGGGAYNQYLVENLKKSQNILNYILPDEVIIDYKEALIFAFLGILRLKREVNILSSATGARSDSIGGTIHDNLQ